MPKRKQDQRLALKAGDAKWVKFLSVVQPALALERANNATQKKYKKRITLAKVSIEGDDK
jgi:hypothetical protein